MRACRDIFSLFCLKTGFLVYVHSSNAKIQAANELFAKLT